MHDDDRAAVTSDAGATPVSMRRRARRRTAFRRTRPGAGAAGRRRATLVAAGLLVLLGCAARPGPGPATGGQAPTRLDAPANLPGWQTMPSPTTETIHAMRIDPHRGDLWVLAESALHRHRADGAWAEPVPAEFDGGLASVYVVRPGLIYGFVRGTSAIVVHRDARWSTIATFDSCVGHDMPLEGLGETVAAGCSYYSSLAIWSGENPGALSPRRDIRPHALAVLGPTEVLALGFEGLALVRLGEPDPIPIRMPPGSAPPRFLWADRAHIVTASRDGEFAHAAWDPATAAARGWTIRRAPGPVRVTALGGAAFDALVAVGRGGAILEFDGHAWSLARFPTAVDLLSVAVGPAGAWIGGTGGLLLHRPAR